MSTDLTPEGLERIEGLARAATGGEWTWEDNPPTLYAGRTCPEFDSTKPETWCGGTHGLNLLGRLEPDCNGKNNLDFICAANPQTILALVARVRELELESRSATEHAVAMVEARDLLQERMRELEEAVRSALESGKRREDKYEIPWACAQDLASALDGAKGGKEN